MRIVASSAAGAGVAGVASWAGGMSLIGYLLLANANKKRRVHRSEDP